MKEQDLREVLAVQRARRRALPTMYLHPDTYAQMKAVLGEPEITVGGMAIYEWADDGTIKPPKKRGK